MAFGLENIEGLDFLDNINFDFFIQGAGFVALIIFVFCIIGAFIFMISLWVKNKKLDNKKIFWFEEVHGEVIPTDEDVARELIIPGTNVHVFYIKKRKLYLPRPVKRMGKDGYWLAVKNNREIVNFTLQNINQHAEAELEYDHTDMRYAYANLQELIKRNYVDHSQPWWREYKDVIGLVILIFVLTISFVFLFTKISGLIGDLGSLVKEIEQLMLRADSLKGSGVVTA